MEPGKSIVFRKIKIIAATVLAAVFLTSLIYWWNYWHKRHLLEEYEKAVRESPPEPPFNATFFINPKINKTIFKVGEIAEIDVTIKNAGAMGGIFVDDIYKFQWEIQCSNQSVLQFESVQPKSEIYKVIKQPSPTRQDIFINIQETLQKFAKQPQNRKIIFKTVKPGRILIYLHSGGKPASIKTGCVEYAILVTNG